MTSQNKEMHSGYHWQSTLSSTMFCGAYNGVREILKKIACSSVLLLVKSSIFYVFIVIFKEIFFELNIMCYAGFESMFFVLLILASQLKI